MLADEGGPFRAIQRPAGGRDRTACTLRGTDRGHLYSPVMSADLDALVALMPFAGQLGLVLDEAGPR